MCRFHSIAPSLFSRTLRPSEQLCLRIYLLLLLLLQLLLLLHLLLLLLRHLLLLLLLLLGHLLLLLLLFELLGFLLLLGLQLPHPLSLLGLLRLLGLQLLLPLRLGRSRGRSWRARAATKHHSVNSSAHIYGSLKTILGIPLRKHRNSSAQDRAVAERQPPQRNDINGR